MMDPNRIVNTEDAHDQLPSAEEAHMNRSSAAVPSGSADDGNCLPSAEEAKIAVGKSTTQNAPWQKYVIWGMAVLGVFTALMVTLTLVLSYEKMGTVSSGPSSSTSGPTTRYDEIVDFLLKEDLANILELKNTVYPQQRAATFMTQSDASEYPVPTSMSSSGASKFLQRYALAVIFYAFQGPGWSSSLSFVTDENECNWFSIVDGSSSMSRRGLIRQGVTCDETSGEVTSLILTGNNLKGRIPREISLLTGLTTLDLHSNKLIGGLPSTIQELTELDWLTLHYNGLDGSVPEWIGELTKLSVLALSNNEFTGSLPSTLGSLTAMETFALDDNFLTGNITVLDSLTNLKSLYLEDNQLTGEIDNSFLKPLSKLQHLDLSNNMFSGTVAEHLLDAEFLEVLDLHHNKLSGSLPDIPDNQMLKVLALHENDIEGPMPATISNLKSLSSLDLSNNRLTGDIVPAVGSMTSLTYLFLANNNFTSGPIPDFLEELTLLQELSLKDTQRTGPIPDWVGSFGDLVLLDLDDNSLNGTIPASLANSTKLRFILLNRNELTGAVPAELLNLPDLDMLLLEINALTGSTGQLGCEENKLSIFVADCEVDCPCCTWCCSGEGCNDEELLANIDPIWERDYNREVYVFGNATSFDEKGLIAP